MRDPDVRIVRAVRARLAAAFLGLGRWPIATTLGDITLFPHQREAARRAAALLAARRTCLLADDVGLGKTFTALAAVRALRERRAARYGGELPAGIEVIAPAGLVAMWRAAARRAGVPLAHCLSLHRFSTAKPPQRVAGPRRRLVVVDEAHHLRNTATRRYRAVAEFVRGARVLLISATPVHNADDDLTALLALALGSRARRLATASRLGLVIRRLADDTAARTGAMAGRTAVPPSARRPEIVRWPLATLAPLAAAAHGTDGRAGDAGLAGAAQQLVAAIAALPPPLPTDDGRAAAALVRLGLLRAWCSSAAAFGAALRARRLRTAALADALAAGVRPTRALLAAWTVGDDAGQIALPALLTAGGARRAPASASARPAPSPGSAAGAPTATRSNGPAEPPRDGDATALAAHRDALAVLAAKHAAIAGAADDARAAALRRVRARHPGATVVVFAHSAATIRALATRLLPDGGVAWLTARGGRVAGGPVGRAELLRRVAPRAAGVAPPPVHEQVTLLLTTDLLSEGVNLQDASVVVHADLPWTPAARDQREGRIVRLGGPHGTVHAYLLPPPGDAWRALRLAARWRRKRRAAARALGVAPPAAARNATDASRPRPATPPPASLVRILERWWREAPPPPPGGARARAQPATALVMQPAPIRRGAWLAVVRVGRRRRLVAGSWRSLPPRAGDGAPRIRAAVRSRAGAVAAIVGVADTVRRTQPCTPRSAPPGRASDGPPNGGGSAPPDAAGIRRAIRRAVRRAHARSSAAVLLLGGRSPVGRARRALRAAVVALPLAHRTALDETLRSAHARLASARSAGDELALGEWLETRHADATAAWLGRTPPPPDGRTGADALPGRPHRSAAATVRLGAVLVLVPTPERGR